jgi:hypothetical protein
MMIREESGSTAMARTSPCDRRAAPGSRRLECCPGGSAIRPDSPEHRGKSQPWGVACPGRSNVLDPYLADTNCNHGNPNARRVTFALAGATLTVTARGLTEPGTGSATLAGLTNSRNLSLHVH